MKNNNHIGLWSLAKRETLRFFVVFSQTIVPPFISSTLFLFVFGLSLGSNINLNFSGRSYLEFMVPGLIMMHLIESPYTNTSSSLFISRWHNMIQELLLSPLSYFEMVLGLLAGGVTRGLVVASGVYVVSLFFVQFAFFNFGIVLYFMLVVTIIFSCLGLIIGLWADTFEKLSFLGSFILTPLIYFGGVFHSVQMIPESLRFLSYMNPIFYLVSGFRYGMIGLADVPVHISMVLAAVMAVVLFIVVERLFRSGYHLRS